MVHHHNTTSSPSVQKATATATSLKILKGLIQCLSSTQALFYNYKQLPIQRMLDFDFLYESLTLVLKDSRKLFFGQEETVIPVHSTSKAACAVHPTADVFINFASFRSAAASSKLALKQPTIRVVAIIAEGVPESDTKELIFYARSNNKVVIGPATVGGIQAGAFKIGDTAGTIDNIIQCKLYRPGCVGFVSKSDGMSNELHNTITCVTDGIYEVCAWVSGTWARLFKFEVQFGHAGAKSGGEMESAQAKNQALKDAGTEVPTSFESFETSIKETYEKLVRFPCLKTLPFIFPFCPSRTQKSEEPCYAGVQMSTIVEKGMGVGDVISLLWFKRSLPRYCTQFIEICIMLCVGHDTCVRCVFGAHNTIITARAGKGLVSSLDSETFTIRICRKFVLPLARVQTIYT
ncbi:hypothetical protein L2E82_45558 [Cichorium intybus]|uniref:Uncharacterized protein n=1 Tax=Cichorium intybus TaxID=13427 RepID=A0ACB8ZTN3_CICIN|nr:hypothetical protein L2E82_45558 [Cichorium intybus]